MRLDKYLKVSRILKRRTVANELASNGRVSVNGKIAKPSADVDVGDEIEVVFGNRRMSTDALAERLRRSGFSCELLSGDVSQERRMRV
ncbi:MAG: hypothetical protein II602_02675, partial [Erysipelotrichales bacterium]|nr:hypothetical protein [Erysipelotrichales bacterium]